MKNVQLIKNNLHTCLHDKVFNWYINDIIETAKCFVVFNDDVEKWIRILHKQFKIEFTSTLFFVVNYDYDYDFSFFYYSFSSSLLNDDYEYQQHRVENNTFAKLIDQQHEVFDSSHIDVEHFEHYYENIVIDVSFHDEVFDSFHVASTS